VRRGFSKAAGLFCMPMKRLNIFQRAPAVVALRQRVSGTSCFSARSVTPLLRFAHTRLHIEARGALGLGVFHQ